MRFRAERSVLKSCSAGADRKKCTKKRSTRNGAVRWARRHTSRRARASPPPPARKGPSARRASRAPSAPSNARARSNRARGFFPPTPPGPARSLTRKYLAPPSLSTRLSLRAQLLLDVRLGLRLPRLSRPRSPRRAPRSLRREGQHLRARGDDVHPRRQGVRGRAHGRHRRVQEQHRRVQEARRARLPHQTHRGDRALRLARGRQVQDARRHLRAGRRRPLHLRMQARRVRARRVPPAHRPRVFPPR